MTNTSATGGYLAPAVSPAPLEDDALADFLQAVVVGISGLPGAQVRPRWQENPPAQPQRPVTWMAVGISTRTTEGLAYTAHTDSGDDLVRYERLAMLVTTYGPNAEANASALRDGFMIAQNREALRSAGFALVMTGDLEHAPELIKGQWRSRVDLTVTLRREIRRQYPVLSLLSASGVLIANTAAGTLTTPIKAQ